MKLAAILAMLLLAVACESDPLTARKRAEEEKMKAQVEAEQAAERAAMEKARARAELEKEQAKIDELARQLSSAKDEAERSVLQKQLEAVKQKLRDTRDAGAAPAKRPQHPCDPNDPLCGI
jgi:transcription termination factor Rho